MGNVATHCSLSEDVREAVKGRCQQLIDRGHSPLVVAVSRSGLDESPVWDVVVRCCTASGKQPALLRMCEISAKNCINSP